jgi:hypothetical protein
MTDHIPEFLTQQEVKLTVRSQYGSNALYPANKTAEVFAQLLGTKTITQEKLRIILLLGYHVTYVHDPVVGLPW